jgi:hypothetical protein
VDVVAGSEADVTVPKSGTQKVKFRGGPLDGRERYIADSMKKFEPQGLPEKGMYRPISPGHLIWEWKEA